MIEVPFPFLNPELHKFVEIDEEGYLKFGETRVVDQAYGNELLSGIVKDEKNRFFVQTNGFWVLIEAFDEPYVAEQIYRISPTHWEILLPYDLRMKFELESLSVDEWDRFHGVCENGIPFVMSRKAQSEFFDLVESFDDESVTIHGQRYEIHPWLIDNNDAYLEEFWSEIYRSETPPKFDLEAPSKPLQDVLPQLKLQKCRVAILGAGPSHDAALLAEQGHLVTAFDVSAEAIAQSKENYGHLDNLKLVKDDIFHLSDEYFGQFDLVFEHTCYCAVRPSQRNELVQVWKKLLNEGGHLLGVFFTMDQRHGPPFGGSEWEVRERLKKHFEFLYWTRWRKSIPRRLGKELVVYAKMK